MRGGGETEGQNRVAKGVKEGFLCPLVITSSINFNTKISDAKTEPSVIMQVVGRERFRVIYVVLHGRVKVVFPDALYQKKHDEDIRQAEEV